MVVEKEHECIFELLQEMKKTCNGDVLPADSPPYYGWCDIDNEIIHKIHAGKVSKSLKACPDIEIRKIINEHFLNRNQQGLPDLLGKIPDDLDKILILKAFW